MSLGYSRGSFSCRSAWLGWDTRTARTSLELCTQGWSSALPAECPPGMAAAQGGHTAGLALVAQVKLSHSILVTLWLVQLLQGTDFGCSGAQLGPWCSAQLSARRLPVLCTLPESAKSIPAHLNPWLHVSAALLLPPPRQGQAAAGK